MKTAALTLLAILGLGFCSSCASRDDVVLTDARTGKPIVGANVYPIYPSFGGASYPTNSQGVAHVGGFGIPRGGYGVKVNAPGYDEKFVGTYPTPDNHQGWNGDNMNISLEPTTQQTAPAR